MICVSLGNIELKRAQEIVATEDLVELRLDLLGPSKDLKLLLGKKAKIIATHRGHEDADVRTRMLVAALEQGANFVDVDLDAAASYRTAVFLAARKLGTQVIVSYHNFEQTPAMEELKKIVKKARATGADFVKIATMATTSQEACRLLAILEDEDKLIVVAMGKYSKLVRAVAPQLGSLWSYAAADGADGTAPGQPSVSELRMVERLLKE